MATKMVNTVTGPVAADELGKTLMHEHIIFGYPGWIGDQTIAPFDRQAIVDTAVTILNELKTFGLKTYVDATTNECARCPDIYKEVSEKTGVNIICSTGYYYEEEGAPAYWRFRNNFGNAVEELHELFVKEITDGIQNTGIKPGVIKIASGHNAISDYEKVMFQAAAGAAGDTGVPIITHTQMGTMGPEQAELLISEGVDPKKIMIGHMSDNIDITYHEKTLEQGVYTAWDRMGVQGIMNCPMDTDRYPVIAELIKKGYGKQIMISHDHITTMLGRPMEFPDFVEPLFANWHPTHLFKNIIPTLKDLGITDDQISDIVEGNPKNLFSG